MANITATVSVIRSAVEARINAGASLSEALRGAIREHGPIRSARVSSAQAKGRAKGYAYWGAVRYAIRIGRDGSLVNMPLERASSDRRSERLAWEDCEDLCNSEDRMDMGIIGRVSDRIVALNLGIRPEVYELVRECA